MRLMRRQFWKPVKCSGYLKKENDGRRVELIKDEHGKCFGAQYWGTGDDIPDECNCEGAYEFLKTYYKLVSKEFKGVMVGERDVVTTAFLYADTGCHPNGREFIYCGKQPEDIVRCAIVYYQPGKKRFVPKECIEIIQEQMMEDM